MPVAVVLVVQSAAAVAEKRERGGAAPAATQHPQKKWYIRFAARGELRCCSKLHTMSTVCSALLVPLPYYYSSIMLLAGGATTTTTNQKHCMPSYLPYVFHEASRTPSSITDPILMGFLTTMLVMLVLLLEFEAYSAEKSDGKSNTAVGTVAAQQRLPDAMAMAKGFDTSSNYEHRYSPPKKDSKCKQCYDCLCRECCSQSDYRQTY